ncbi:MAG: CoA transferase, partial [Parahaliea sp.]
ESKPALIRLSISDFGLTGPYRDFQGGCPVHTALAGVLARSGIEGRDPLQPPGQMAEEAAAVQAAWVLLLAVLQQQWDGRPNHLDFSLFEATAQIIDPGLGVTGSAAGGRTATQLADQGRPPLNPLYPIFPCRDGYVRICVLNPRQWQNMSAWLGDDHPFTDPQYGQLDKRAAVVTEVNALIAQLFADLPGETLVVEGQQRGIPIARLATPTEVLADEHFVARDSFIDWPIGGGADTGEPASGKIASGYLELDGQRCGPRQPPQALSAEQASQRWAPRNPVPPGDTPPADNRALGGLRVLDLGVIVAGAELGRLFADQGAEVIKVENSAYPDGLRQSYLGEKVSASFAQGSRSKLSFGLNLRHPEGVKVFLELVKHSDVVLSNFKPGTLESLGLGYEVLAGVNPGIIVADSSALGRHGPRSKSMGYGPLARASSGLSGLWRYPGDTQAGFSDGVTIYPDHFAARVSAVGIAAALVRRLATGRGGTVSVAQVECILNALATEFLHESLQPGALQPRGNADPFDAPGNVFPCAGTDQWCAIHIRNDVDFQRLCIAIGKPELAQEAAYATPRQRLDNRGTLETVVRNWTRERSAEDAMRQLQAQGVPAGRMLRLEELEQNEQLLSRLFFRRLVQPELSRPLLTVNGPVSCSMLAEPDIRPAPRFGQHTRALAAGLLQLDSDTIQAYFEQGILEGE